MPSPSSPTNPSPSGKENNITFQDKGDKKEDPERSTQPQFRDLSTPVVDHSIEHQVTVSGKMDMNTKDTNDSSEKVSKKPPRCGKCNKKMVVTFDCTCSLLFCVNHRLPESHDCRDLHVLVEKERQKNKDMLFKLSNDTKTQTLKDRI